ncbi:MAG: HPr family phosphocarrier protein [Mycoplasma sp.]
MKNFTVTIIDPIGLHARPASEMVQVASKFASDITITYGDKKGNAKSIITIMALGVKTGAEISFEINGADEADAEAAIKKQLVVSKIIGE